MERFVTHFSLPTSHFSLQRGFTLIELVLYMGLMTILIGALSTIFTTIVDVQTESKSTSSVDQDGRYILAKLLYDFQGNTPVVINTPSSLGTPSTSLVLTLSGTSTTYSVNGSNNLILTNSYGSNQVNSSDTSVATFSATRIGNGSTTDTVEVNFTVTSRTKQRSGYESKSFTSTFAGHN